MHTRDQDDKKGSDCNRGEEGQVTLLKNETKLDEALEYLTKRIAKGGGITLLGSGFGKVVQVGFHILLGRILGAGGYGLYALGYSVIQLASQISTLGLRSGIVRFVALYKGEGNLQRVKGTLISAILITSLASVVVGILLLLFAESISAKIFNDPQLTLVLRVFGLSLPFFVLMEMAADASRGFQRMDYYVGIRNLIWPISNALLVGIAFLLGYRLIGAIYGFLASMVLSATLGLFFIRKKIFPEGSSLQPDYEVKRLLRFSLPVIFVGFGQYLLSQADRLMIGYFMTSGNVGIYNAASMIATQTAFFIINSVNLVFAPVIADLYNQQRVRELDSLFKVVTRWIVTLTLPGVLIMVFFPKPVMGLFGAGFEEGSIVLIVLILACLVDAASGPVGLILIMSGKQNIELLNTLSMAVINIGLNIWLIQIYGIVGAAVATGFSIAIVNIIRLIVVYKLIGIQPYTRKYFKPVGSALAVFLLLLFLTGQGGIGLHWVIGLALCLLLYGGVILILGFESEDRLVMRAIWNKLSPFLH